MPKPNIIILSRSSPNTIRLPASLSDHWDCHVCETVGDLPKLLTERQPCAVVADFRTAITGGQAEARLIDQLRRHTSELPIILLTRDDVPRPLRRLTTIPGIMHLSGKLSSQQLADALQKHLADAPSLRHDRSMLSNDFPDERFGERAVLTGITRRFETYTPQLQQMLADLEVAARHDVTILLIGETGSGKTFLSRLIHEVSSRRDQPFLTVACGALPGDLIESELFGHRRGAFTSAHADKHGRFVAAGRGTILLDEIDVLAPEQQAKLLRVIETGEFEPIGSNQTHKSQARLVVASNRDLHPLVEQGQFRADLYYRLNMLKFEIPPLRKRRPDITPLARMFIQQASARHKVEIRDVDKSLFATLQEYPWPGNVRELENVIQRAVIYCRDGILRADQLPPNIPASAAGIRKTPLVSRSNSQVPTTRSALGRQVAVTEREIIEQTLFQHNFSRTNTAKALGISRVTLYNKMKKYGMSAQS